MSISQIKFRSIILCHLLGVITKIPTIFTDATRHIDQGVTNIFHLRGKNNLGNNKSSQNLDSSQYSHKATNKVLTNIFQTSNKSQTSWDRPNVNQHGNSTNVVSNYPKISCLGIQRLELIFIEYLFLMLSYLLLKNRQFHLTLDASLMNYMTEP